jgi:hypothetical protein
MLDNPVESLTPKGPLDSDCPQEPLSLPPKAINLRRSPVL